MSKTHKDVTVVVKGVLATIPDDRIGYMVQTAMAGRCAAVDVVEIAPESAPEPEPTSPTPKPEPTTKAEAKREEKIAVAIQSLKASDASAWNQDGSPKVAAVREAGGEDLSDVSADEVHAVWATFE